MPSFRDFGLSPTWSYPVGDASSPDNGETSHAAVKWPRQYRPVSLRVDDPSCSAQAYRRLSGEQGYSFHDTCHRRSEPQWITQARSWTSRISLSNCT
ncbi:hypothetical protein V2G26_012562 [Clonostachys chloroleuca]